MTSYKVDSAWVPHVVRNVDDCLTRLLAHPLNNGPRVFHGAHDSIHATLLSSLDLHAQHSQVRLTIQLETLLLERFWSQSRFHLHPAARRLLETARVRWGTIRNSGTMFVGRHYGLPTRCIDWTTDALTGLFFACRRHHGKDGVLWWVDKQHFLERLATQWPTAFGKPSAIEDDFERHLIEGTELDVLVPLKFPEAAPRPIAQRGIATFAGRLAVDHAECLSKIGVGNCGRIVIPAALKAALLERMDSMGCNGYSLEIGDSTIETIAADVSKETSGR